MSRTAQTGHKSRIGRGAPVPWGAILRNVGLALAVLAGIWLVFNVRLPPLGELRDDIAELGAWGPIVFVLASAAVAATPIPVTIMAVAGGLVFGLPIGTVLSLIGVIVGAYIGYWIARGLGRETVTRMLGSHAETVESRLADGGFYAVVTLRLMPGFPYWPVNYGAGAFRINTRTFVTATLVSSLPGQFSLVAVGSFIGHPGVFHAIMVAISWAIVLTLTLIAFRRWRTNTKTAQLVEEEGETSAGTQASDDSRVIDDS